MNELLSFFHLGVEIKYLDGVLLGVICILYLIIVSWTTTQTICERLKEKSIDKGLFLFFIITTISFLIKNTQIHTYIANKYPLFLTYLELLRFGEIFLIVILVIVFLAVGGYILLIQIALSGLVAMLVSYLLYFGLQYIIVNIFHSQFFINGDVFIVGFVIFWWYLLFKSPVIEFNRHLVFFQKIFIKM